MGLTLCVTGRSSSGRLGSSSGGALYDRRSAYKLTYTGSRKPVWIYGQAPASTAGARCLGLPKNNEKDAPGRAGGGLLGCLLGVVVRCGAGIRGLFDRSAVHLSWVLLDWRVK